MHGRGGVAEWIGRIRAAADWTRAKWLVVLEDDVRVDGPITRWPATDAGGVEDHRWTAPLKPELLREMTRRSAGGSLKSTGSHSRPTGHGLTPFIRRFQAVFHFSTDVWRYTSRASRIIVKSSLSNRASRVEPLKSSARIRE